MQIEALLTMGEEERRAALRRNATRLRRRARRDDAACYIEDMLAELRQVAETAKLKTVVTSIDSTLKAVAGCKRSKRG